MKNKALHITLNKKRKKGIHRDLNFFYFKYFFPTIYAFD